MVVPAGAPFATSPGNGLPTVAQVGIGIGAAAVGLAFMALGFAWFVWRRRSRQKDEQDEDIVPNQAQQDSLGESNNSTDEPGPSWGYKSELPADPRHVYRAELPGNDTVEPMLSSTEQSMGEGSEFGPVSPVSVGEESTLDRHRSATISNVDCLSPMSERAPDLAEANDPGFLREDGTRDSVERRYGEGTRLEAIPELHAE